MSERLSATDVVRDVEFELLQGVVSRDEIGQALQSLREHQYKARSRMLQGGSTAAGAADALRRQYEITEMVITLLQEMNSRVNDLQLEVRRVGALPREIREPIPDAARGVQTDLTDAPDAATSWLLPHSPRQTEEIERSMGGEALDVSMITSTGSVPLIGWLVNRVRVFFHARGLLYARALASKQAPINQTYGDWLLYLNGVNQQQQAEIASLRAEVSALRAEQGANGPGR
jgi:hypothetical protein